MLGEVAGDQQAADSGERNASLGAATAGGTGSVGVGVTQQGYSDQGSLAIAPLMLKTALNGYNQPFRLKNKYGTTAETTIRPSAEG
jgi:hypothetical protein